MSFHCNGLLHLTKVSSCNGIDWGKKKTKTDVKREFSKYVANVSCTPVEHLVPAGCRYPEVWREGQRSK